MNYKNFSDESLLSEIQTQVRTEREAQIAVLHCLREIDIRKLHLTRGFGSLHEFLVKALHYSDGAAHRRLNAMRLLKELPQVELKLSQGKVSLSTVSKLQDFLTAEKKRNTPVTSTEKLELLELLELLESISGKSGRQTESLLAARFPQNARPDRVHAISEEMVSIHLTLPKEVIVKLDELKALLAHGLVNANGYSDLITNLIERVLKEERRKREIKNVGTTASPEKFKQSNHQSTSQNTNQNSERNRFANTTLKRQIWTRAQSCCEYIDTKTKRRCESRFALEIDHINPWADGGATVLENLQLLCGSHHRQKTKLRSQYRSHTSSKPRTPQSYASIRKDFKCKLNFTPQLCFIFVYCSPRFRKLRQRICLIHKF